MCVFSGIFGNRGGEKSYLIVSIMEKTQKTPVPYEKRSGKGSE